jgi:hypothetical protein
MRRALALLLGAAWVVAGCGSSGSPLTRGDQHSRDVFELAAKFEGDAAKLLGSSREWYSPGTGFYDADRRLRDKNARSVYNGATIFHRVDRRVFRQEGAPAVLHAIASRHVIFELPAVVAVDAYLRGKRSPDLVVKPHDGGRSFAVDFHYREEGGDTHFRYRVDVRRRETLAEARKHGRFGALDGRVVGVFKQSPPGTRPHFGERAYWFGPRLGAAKAVTALESWGYDPFTTDAPPRTSTKPGASYTTIYRLPKSTLPPPYPDQAGAIYPGIGAILPIDIEVRTQERHGSFLPGLLPSTRGRPITLRSGQRATLYVNPYTQGSRSGITADIVFDSTVCFVHGLVSPKSLAELAPSLVALSPAKS